MTGYDLKFYEAQLPSIIRSLNSIASSLETITEAIVSDPGDEVEHIYAKDSYSEESITDISDMD